MSHDTRTGRVGILGGTFDPVHNAHLALAQAALDACALDTVRWVPSGQPWQKDRTITPAIDREAMVRIAIEGHARFVLDRIELERPGPSYTLDTVRQLRRNEPDVDWVLILGRDQYDGLPTWHGFDELLGLVSLAVAERPGVAGQRVAHPYHALPMSLHDIASTAIRDAVRQGQDISLWVPPGVARYIESQDLYRVRNRS